MKRFLALGFALATVLFVYPAGAQITIKERTYIPEPQKVEVEVEECDFVKMVNHLSFRIVEKGSGGKYYDLVSEKNRDERYQIFTVVLKNCKIEQAEKTEWRREAVSSVDYKFLLAEFTIDIDGGKTADGFKKVLPVVVRVYLETDIYPLSLERQGFFDRILRTLKLEAAKGEMRYIVYGRGKDSLFPQSPGEISSMDIFIRVEIK